MKEHALYVSIWDFDTRIETRCEFDTETNKASNIEDSDEEIDGILIEEFIELQDGTKISSFINEDIDSVILDGDLNEYLDSDTAVFFNNKCIYIEDSILYIDNDLIDNVSFKYEMGNDISIYYIDTKLGFTLEYQEDEDGYYIEVNDEFWYLADISMRN